MERAEGRVTIMGLENKVNDLRGWKGTQGRIHLSVRDEDFYTRNKISFQRAIDFAKGYLGYESISRVVPWMQLIAGWAWEHPTQEISFSVKRGTSLHTDYTIIRCDDHIIIRLPYHDAGGEKTWITKDLRSKHLVDVD